MTKACCKTKHQFLTKDEMDKIIEYYMQNDMWDDYLFFMLKCNSILGMHDISILHFQDLLEKDGRGINRGYDINYGYSARVNETCQTAISNYLAKSGIKSEVYLFKFNMDRAFLRRLRKIAKSLNIEKKISSYALSLTYKISLANDILEQCGDPEMLKAILCESCSCRSLEQLVNNLEV